MEITLSAWMLRSIPNELMQMFKREAKQRRMSVNKTIVSLMLEKFGIAEEKKVQVHHDLDAWFGKWTAKEAIPASVTI